MKHQLGKLQVKRILEGKPVSAGNKQLIVKDEKTKEVLQLIDQHNAYKDYCIWLEDETLHVDRK